MGDALCGHCVLQYWVSTMLWNDRLWIIVLGVLHYDIELVVICAAILQYFKNTQHLRLCASFGWHMDVIYNEWMSFGWHWIVIYNEWMSFEWQWMSFTMNGCHLGDNGCHLQWMDVIWVTVDVIWQGMNVIWMIYGCQMITNGSHWVTCGCHWTVSGRHLIDKWVSVGWHIV